MLHTYYDCYKIFKYFEDDELPVKVKFVSHKNLQHYMVILTIIAAFRSMVLALRSQL